MTERKRKFTTIKKRHIGALALLLLSQSPAVLADCSVTGPTPSGGQAVSCTSPPVDLDGYTGTAFDDQIIVNIGALVNTVGSSAIQGNGGNDTITMLGGTITAGVDDAILLSGALADTVTVAVSGGLVDGDRNAIRVIGSLANISVSSGQVRSNNSSIFVGGTLGGTATIAVNGGIIDSTTNDGIETSLNTPAIVTVSAGTITGNTTGISIGGEANITVTGGSITGTTNVGIRTGDASDTISVSGGTITGAGSVPIQTGRGADAVNISGGTINGNINTNNDNDVITLSGGTITGGIYAGFGNDTVTLADDVDVGVLVGFDGFDTLQFAMTVPAADLASLQTALAAANPAGDSITINGRNYSWTTFEAIEVLLRAPSHAVPTMQEWALALLCGLLFLRVFFFTRHQRQVTKFF